MKQLLGRTDDFTEGCFRVVEVDGKEIGVYRRDGEFYALLNLCPHRDAPICAGVVTGTMLPSEPGEFQYGLEGWVLRCPWHGWEFDIRSGRSLFDVDRRRLRVYPVHVADGEVYCELGTRE